jgi:hypothetical protein
VLAAALLGVTQASAGAPEWLRAAAHVPLPAYPPETEAVILVDEQVTTVKDSGEIETGYRRAYKILRPEGRVYGSVVVFFNDPVLFTTRPVLSGEDASPRFVD